MSSWRNSLCLVLLLLLLVVKGEGVLLNLQSNGISIYSTSEDLTRIESILWSSSANKNLPSLEEFNLFIAPTSFVSGVSLSVLSKEEISVSLQGFMINITNNTSSLFIEDSTGLFQNAVVEDKNEMLVLSGSIFRLVCVSNTNVCFWLKNMQNMKIVTRGCSSSSDPCCNEPSTIDDCYCDQRYSISNFGDDLTYNGINITAECEILITGNGRLTITDSIFDCKEGPITFKTSSDLSILDGSNIYALGDIFIQGDSVSIDKSEISGFKRDLIDFHCVRFE